MLMEVLKHWYVELEPGVWLVEGDGDPPRCLDAMLCAMAWGFNRIQAGERR